jgi:hypothetical protein
LTGVLDPQVTFTRAANTATRINSSGTLETVLTNVPRFDYNPTSLACRGLLVEAASTNSIRNSTATGAVAGTPGTAPTNWVNFTALFSGIQASIAAVGTENGVEYVDVNFTGTATASANLRYDFEPGNVIAAAVGQTWSQSVYIKTVSGTPPNVVLNLIERSAAGGLLVSSLSGALTLSATNLLNGRGGSTHTLSNASTAFVQNGVRFSVVNGTAYNFTLRIGLPQLEQSPSITSVIKTSSAAVARNADVAVMTGANFSSWWQSTRGAAVVQVLPSTVSGVRPTVAFDDTTANNVIVLRGNGTNPELYIRATTDQVQIDAGTIAANTAYILAGAWNTDDCAAAVNGAAAVTDTSAAIPTVTQARLGSDGTNYLNGHLQTLRYWPQRLINAEVQAFSK